MSKLIGSLVIILCIIGVCTAFFLGFTPSQASVEIAELPVRDYLDQFNVIGDIARDYVENIRDTLGELSTFYEHYQYWEFDKDDEAFRQTMYELGIIDSPDELDESNGVVKFLVSFLSIITHMWSYIIQFIILVSWSFRIIVTIVMILVHSIGFFVDCISAFLSLLLGVGFGEYLL